MVWKFPAKNLNSWYESVKVFMSGCPFYSCKLLFPMPHETRNLWFSWIVHQFLAFEEFGGAGNQIIWAYLKILKNWKLIYEKIIQSFKDFKVCHIIFRDLNEMVRYISWNLSGEEWRYWIAHGVNVGLLIERLPLQASLGTWLGLGK